MAPRLKPRVARTCGLCSKVFHPRYRSDRKKRRAFYCSRDCFRSVHKFQQTPQGIMALTRRNGSCLEWIGSFSPATGYGLCGQVGAHRVSYTVFKGPIPEGMQVCHHCDNRICVEPTHLFLGTALDNARDKVLKGRQPKGPRKPEHIRYGADSPAAKLHPGQVRRIREMISKGVQLKVIAAQFYVSPGTIGFIKSGKTWGHLK